MSAVKVEADGEGADNRNPVRLISIAGHCMDGCCTYTAPRTIGRVAELSVGFAQVFESWEEVQELVALADSEVVAGSRFSIVRVASSICSIAS